MECARLLAERGPVDVDQHICATPLFVAAERGHDACAKMLMDLGADPDAETEEGATPLLVATQNRHARCVRALLDGGADPNLPAPSGTTPLGVAEINDSRDIGRIISGAGGVSMIGGISDSEDGDLSDDLDLPLDLEDDEDYDFLGEEDFDGGAIDGGARDGIIAFTPNGANFFVLNQTNN